MINWRLYLAGGLIFAMFAVSIWIAHLQIEKIKSDNAAAAAKVQTIVSEGTAAALDRTIIKERTITQEVQNVVREIDAMPTGEALVPDDVASAWADGIDGLRNATANLEGDSTGKPQDLSKD